MEYFLSGKFYETVIVVLFTVVVLAIIKGFDKKYLRKSLRNKSWYSSAKKVNDILTSIFVVIMILIVLSINGINVRAYVTSLGVMGICLSFALQDYLKDVIMGVTIIAEGYYKPGDVISFEGRVGKVISINLKTTKVFLIDTEDTMSICNRNIDKVSIVSDWFDIDIPIGYDTDLYYSRAICRECAKKIERLRYVYSCDFLNTQNLSESWVDYRVRVHCLPEKKPPVRRAALAVIQDVFYEHDAEFPLSIKVLYSQPEIKSGKKISGLSVTRDDTNHETLVKADYELGHGAAKSKKINVDDSSNSRIKAVNEAERYAASENLSKKSVLKMRLLTEELMSVIQRIPHIESGIFYIERDGGDYDICFSADSKLNRKTTKELITISTSEKNDAYAGFGGMIANAVDNMILLGRDGKNDKNTKMKQSITGSSEEYRWSYNIYKETEESINEVNLEEEDELIKSDWREIERSVLNKLSDDIKISVRPNQIEIRVLVKDES